MKLTSALLLSLLSVALAIPAGAQNSADDLPDGPHATAAAMIVPNGPKVVFDTSMGRMTCQFYQKEAPIATANFIRLAEGKQRWRDPRTDQIHTNKPLFDGTIFHRVIPGFMIQGGDPAGTGLGDPGFSFRDEIVRGLNFDRPGRLAMANSGPNTNGSQFFITEAAYPSLNGSYTLFGQCDESAQLVVSAITNLSRDANDRPLKPPVLVKATIVREGEPMPAVPEGARLTPGFAR